MRKIVEPPPSSKCGHCGGWLKLKRIDSNFTIGVNSQVFSCAMCGVDRVFTARRDLYAARLSGAGETRVGT